MLLFYFNICNENKANISQLLPYNFIDCRGSLLLYRIHTPTNIPTLLQLVILLHIKGVVQLKTFK